MTRDKRLLLLLMVSGLFVVECRYHQREDEATTTTTEARHRHRHRHESSNRRNHHELDRRTWQEVDDYEYDTDSEDPMNEDEAQSYYDHRRSHHRSAQRSYHGRMFEPRYPARYHGYYAASGWHDDNNDRRRIPSRYNTKSRHRPGKSYHRPVYSRNRDVSDFDDYTEEDYDYERPRTYVENDGVDKRYERWRNSRRHASSRKDWRSRVNGYRNARRYHLEDREDVDRGDALRSTDDWRRRSNTSESRYRFSKDDRKTEEDEDYEDHGGLEEDDKDEEDDDIWKLIDDNEDNEEEVLDDDDSYKNKTKPPLKTYDDIIKRLTSDDPTTPKTTKRDYRNIEANRHAKRDSVKDFKYDSRNVSKPEDFFTSAPHTAATTSNYFVNKRTAENSTVKSAGSAERKPPKNAIGLTVRDNVRQEGKSAVKIDTQAKNKNLEQDLYDEYLNTPDNEKEDDVIKADEDSGMQADVTNTDYTDDDNDDEDEATTDIFTTTTTPKSLINQYYDYLKTYDSNTGYNRYQAKNEHPTMSPYSRFKWQSLGTRESVKETRSHMQQHHKNAKGDEIREALQHAIKVNKEGSCQWPRARVIPVRDVYPSPSTTYIPHCVILHRCSDDTGCCRSDTLTCMARSSIRVDLFFYTTTVGRASIVEKLTFYNHTECECKEKSKYYTMNERSADQPIYRQSTSPPQNMERSRPSRKTCRCPLQFMPKMTLEGICQCNCNEHNRNCIKTRRGKGYLSLADRICIQNNECTSPNCEFGEYLLWQGKCPRKQDSIGAADHQTPPQSNSNHRYRMRRAAVDSG